MGESTGRRNATAWTGKVPQVYVDVDREKAKTLGREFSYFSLDPLRSFYFDPFQSVKADELRVIRICNLLVEAMHLDYGLVYGGSYYTQRNLAGLLRGC